jgi:hypothetical protein
VHRATALKKAPGVLACVGGGDGGPGGAAPRLSVGDDPVLRAKVPPVEDGRVDLLHPCLQIEAAHWLQQARRRGGLLGSYDGTGILEVRNCWEVDYFVVCHCECSLMMVCMSSPGGSPSQATSSWDCITHWLELSHCSYELKGAGT